MVRGATHELEDVSLVAMTVDELVLRARGGQCALLRRGEEETAHLDVVAELDKVDVDADADVGVAGLTTVKSSKTVRYTVAAPSSSVAEARQRGSS